MSEAKLVARFENGKPMVIAGFAERVTTETWDKIDKLWWRFAPHIGKVPGQIGARIAYGAVIDAESGIEYLAGVEVADPPGLPGEFAHVNATPCSNIRVTCRS
jgi:AraC family transcriptional regulator